MIKICKTCEVPKPQSEFSWANKKRGILDPYCKPCRRERSKVWYRQNHSRALTTRRKYRSNHPQKIKEIHKQKTERVRADPERLRRYNDKSLVRVAKRRSLLKNQFVEDVDPRIVFERDEGVCGICSEPVDSGEFHLDHIKPVSKGGEHSYTNVQLAHPGCNLRKSNRLMTVGGPATGPGF